MSEKKPDWWPKCPYPEDIFPMPRKDYVKVVPDPDRRTALSGMLGREFWNIASQSIWDALRDHLEDLENASCSIQPPARIEAAIREIKKYAPGRRYDRVDLVDLLRWVLGQEQDTWTDKDFGLDKETTRSDEGT